MPTCPPALRALAALIALLTSLSAGRPARAGADPRGTPVDWAAAGAEAAALLSGYLQVDDTNPPGRETRGALFLADYFARQGLPSTIYEHAPGRGNLLVRLPGAGLEPPLCLLSHIDVVEAEPARWQVPPQSGAIRDGAVWGRGALDMKGMGAIEAVTVALLARQGARLRRDVVFLAVADEEVDNQGIRHMAARWSEVGCSHVINEGGIGVDGAFFEGQTVFPISVAEKGVLWLQLVAEGLPGHGSTPVPDAAPERLVRAYAALEDRKVRPQWDPSVMELLHAVGAHKGGLAGAILRSPAAVRLLLRGKLMGNPLTRAVLTDTVYVTGFSGARQPNVVPAEVRANIDSRLLPGTSPDEMQRRIEALVADVPGVRVERLSAMHATVSPWDDPLYDALARRVVEGLPNAVAGPALSPGFTDSIYLRELGVRAYGLVPFIVDEAGLRSMHGDDERVSLANLERGVRVLYEAVLDVSTGADGANPEVRAPIPVAPRLDPPRALDDDDLRTLPPDLVSRLRPAPAPELP
jgi:acetylornithine deacetylase/succinyl-diaminopimelate desuccinylase-like protein